MSAFTKQYRCADGHQISAPAHLTVGRCPVYVYGKPCTASVRQVGVGSRGPRKVNA